jgi:hypothetical protein
MSSIIFFLTLLDSVFKKSSPFKTCGTLERHRPLHYIPIQSEILALL